jgi:hypothetical protein
MTIVVTVTQSLRSEVGSDMLLLPYVVFEFVSCFFVYIIPRCVTLHAK